MDHKAFQTDPQTTLIAVCFVSLRLPLLYSQSCAKNIWGAFSRTKRNSYCRCEFGSRTHGGSGYCFPTFYPSTFDLRSHSQSKIRSVFSSFLFIDFSFLTKLRFPFMILAVFFHARDGYWVLIGYQAHLSASLSSLSLFSFLFSSASASLSGPSHMLCVTSCSRQQPYLPWKAQWFQPQINPLHVYRTDWNLGEKKVCKQD